MNKILIAFVAGVAAGILLAPEKGATSRRKLKNGYNGIADKVTGNKSARMYKNALDTIGEHIGATS